MLKTFQPTHGPMVATANPYIYTLPLVQGDDVRAAELTDMTSPIEEGEGRFLTRGMEAMFLDSPQPQYSFAITGPFLLTQPPPHNTTNAQGVYYALMRFIQSVVMGGVGTLVDIPPTGSVLPSTGKTITQYSADVVCVSAAQVTRKVGGTMGLIQATFLFPSPYWTVHLSDGTYDIIPVSI